MAKVRIFEWAKDNNQRSNELVKQLKEQGFNVRNHTSVIDEEILKGLVKNKPKRHFNPGEGNRDNRNNDRNNNRDNNGRYNNDRNNNRDNNGRYNNNRDNNNGQGRYNNNRDNNDRYNNNRDNNGRYNNDRYNNNRDNNGRYNNDRNNNDRYNNNRDNNGRYNNDRNNNQGGQGRYNNNRDNNGRYNNDRNNNQGGQGRYNNNNGQGRYNNNNGQGGQGRYNNNNGQGRYNNNGQGGQGRYNNNNGQGRYNNNNGQGGQGRYNNNNGQGRYNNNNGQGGQGRYNNNNGQGRYNNNNNNGGGYNRNNNFGGPKKPFNRNNNKQEELEPTTSKPATKKGNGNKKRKNTGFDRFAMFDNKEGQIRVDQKTKTQMKKEARKEREAELKNETTQLKWSDDMTVSKFADLIKIPAIDVISKLFELGIMATMNQQIDKESAEILCTDYNVEIVEDDSNQELEFENLMPTYTDADLQPRPAIVTIMGHVDHGKTTLLDTIRNSNVTAKESGGITQHIGAYQVPHKKGAITFLDTPGHAAFTAMRARGAHVTDITIIVVAADDGVMPQTKEAVAHAKDAGTPLIVAVNKMDKPEANPERVMSELAELGVMAEDWGGDVPFVNVSALKGDGITELLDYIEVISEMHDYQAPANVQGFGTVIEANLDKGRGSVATILVQGGEVSVGDAIVIGHTWGSIRVMQDEYGKRHKTVGASMPVEITGLKDVPQAGDQFVIMKDAKEAQTIGEKRSELKAQKDRSRAHAMSLEELNALIAEGDIKELPVVIKADVQGSVEALRSSLEQIEVNGVKVRIVHSGVGAINESDVMLATAGNAILIGFNVRPDANARQLIEKENIDLMLSSIIYKIIEEIEDSMKGMREKKYRQEILGYARVDEVFKITGVGKVAGCIVTSGKITRDCKVRLIRDGVVVYDGDLGQLKRFKDDVKDVVEGMDCGMSFKDFNDIKKGDEFEGYILEEEDLD